MKMVWFCKDSIDFIYKIAFLSSGVFLLIGVTSGEFNITFGFVPGSAIGILYFWLVSRSFAKGMKFNFSYFFLRVSMVFSTLALYYIYTGRMFWYFFSGMIMVKVIAISSLLIPWDTIDPYRK